MFSRLQAPLAIAAILVAGNGRAETLWFALPASPEPCTLDRFGAALASLRPGTETRLGSPPPSVAEPTATIHRDGAGWSLSVIAPGDAELRRSLPDPGASCVSLSEAAAFMITRYLQDIEWHAADAPPVVPPPPLVSGDAVSPIRAVTGVSVEGTMGTTGFAPAFAIYAGLRRGLWELDVAGAVATPTQFVGLSDDGFHDTFQTEAVRLEVPIGRLVALGPGFLRLDLAPGVELDWTSDITYPSASPGFTARAIAGARASWEYAFGERLAMALRLEGRLLLGSQPGWSSAGDHDADDSAPAPVAADCGLSLAISYMIF